MNTRNAWIKGFFSILLLTQFAIGCAVREVRKTNSVDPNEEKFAELNDQIQQQKGEIEKLTAELRNVTARLSLEKAPRRSAHPKPAQPIVPSAKDVQVEKLLPQDDEGELDSNKILHAEDDSVADSGQESMHFYLQALELLEEKRYEQALQSLRSFVTENPTHVYADRAQYLIAETHFQNREYGLVIVATNLLEARYPHSFRLPEALYKRAIAYLSMNQAAPAKTTLQHLLQRYPKDPLAETASKELAKLLQGNNAPPLMPDSAETN